MIAEFMTQSETSLNDLNKEELSLLVTKIKAYFKHEEKPKEITPENVYSFLWSSDPIASENGIFQFCIENNLYSEKNKEYREFLKGIGDRKLLDSEIKLINSTEYNVNEAIRNNVVSIFDIKNITEKNKEELLKKSFITLCSIKNATDRFVSIGLDRLFITFVDEKSEYMPLQRQIDIVLRRVIQHGFDSEGFQYKFLSQKHKTYFYENVEDNWIYYNLFEK